jgi:hypothetical protein
MLSADLFSPVFIYKYICHVSVDVSILTSRCNSAIQHTPFNTEKESKMMLP